MKISEFITNIGQTAKSAGKILLLSRKSPVTRIAPDDQSPLIILANGPSLRKTIDEYGDRLAACRTLCVNFAANAPEFRMIRPDYYLMADPHFYLGTDSELVRLLFDNLSKVDWPMTIFIDRRYKNDFATNLSLPPNVKVETFNNVGAEGFAAFEYFVYKLGLAMPRPRNVLHPAIMTGIRLGYKAIYLCGADHSWMRDLYVTENNEVVSGLSHFYKDPECEKQRTVNVYRNYRLHDIVHSYYTAFKSYHQIERFARRAGIDIYNSTEGSYIDAFRRKPLPL